ncbi:MAG: class I SAM-dependent methyltransferase [Planctomycetaceae bacterium]
MSNIVTAASGNARRELTARDLAYNEMGDGFAKSLSDYDTQRRVEVLIDDFLGGIDLTGRRVLEVGTGLGYFARRLKERGADVTASDLAPNLVRDVERNVGCRAVVADALNLTGSFPGEAFDIVFSSECIEHTPDPAAAVIEMTKLLKPGGLLCLSTPNIVWQPVVRLASTLKLRQFCGYENFSSWRGLRRLLAAQGMTIEREHGLHLYPFQLGLHGFSRLIDARLQCFRAAMINICVLARKS